MGPSANAIAAYCAAGEHLEDYPDGSALALREAIAQLSAERVLEVTRLFHAALIADGVPSPRLALAGLNPHAGEEGLMGDEEIRVLSPASARARQEGMALAGPLPADTLFYRAVQGEFDGVVALYHDQGLIAVKLLGFGAAVNVTLGLKVPRTSPDHGTAFDLVGTGKAREDGMLAAMRLCVRQASWNLPKT